MATLVEKGDVIEFYLKPKDTTTIKWQQNFTDRIAVYVVIPYTVKGKEASGTLFVEQSKSGEFMKSANESEDSENPLFDSKAYTVTVNDDFRYGQDSDKTMRFLVFHDTSYATYQHRFVSTSAFGNIATKIGEQAGKIDAIKGVLDKIMNLGKTYIGDSLRKF